MNSPSLPRLAIFGSGKGSNARALIEATKKSSPHYEVALLLADFPDAGILKLGSEFQIPAHFFDPGPFKTKFSPSAEQELVMLLKAAEVDFIALAGFMRVIKEPLLAAFPARILNIHPSLLPEFPGLQAWQQAYDAGVQETGCTVHLVDEGIDTGKILGQLRVPLLQGESVGALHARIQEAEHMLYPRVVSAFAQELQKKE